MRRHDSDCFTYAFAENDGRPRSLATSELDRVFRAYGGENMSRLCDLVFMAGGAFYWDKAPLGLVAYYLLLDLNERSAAAVNVSVGVPLWPYY